MTEQVTPAELSRLTTRIVEAHLQNPKNKVAASELPQLIEDIYRSFTEIVSILGEQRPREPAVPVDKSITPNHIVCLEDGKKLKMLKRHLKVAYDLTPQQYRERWNLPASYPMVAPNYAKRRSEIAKDLGLGKVGKSRRRATKN